MHSDPILIIGGTRATGLLAAQSLIRRGQPVRVLARDPARAVRRLNPATEIVAGDLTKKHTLPSAFRGVKHVILTAGVRSGRFARESVVKATEYEGILNTLEAAGAQGFHGRFIYMTAIGVTQRSALASALNLWKGNTLVWRRHAENAIRSSGFDYTIVRAAFLLNRRPDTRAIRVSQGDAPLTFHECIARADVAEALIAALDHPSTIRATFEIRWGNGPRNSTWSALFSDVKPD